ncbi:MAG: DUF4185 domain-containing protein, partial [Tannerella sp.]|nr:DUF4185 domain-containing protein [Tannerella sp.]
MKRRYIKKQVLYIIFIAYTSVLHSCSKSDPDKLYAPVDEITSSETDLIPNKETKVVSTILSFKNTEDIDYLLVRKSGGDSYSAKINRNELSSSYVFR